MCQVLCYLLKEWSGILSSWSLLPKSKKVWTGNYKWDKPVKTCRNVTAPLFCVWIPLWRDDSDTSWLPSSLGVEIGTGRPYTETLNMSHVQNWEKKNMIFFILSQGVEMSIFKCISDMVTWIFPGVWWPGRPVWAYLLLRCERTGHVPMT